MPLILPNQIEADTTADAVEVEQNNGVLTQYVNTNLINRDGSVAMTNPLLLPGDPSQPNQAANKGYIDGLNALKVAKAGDTMAGNLTVPNALISGAQGVEVNAVTRKDYVDNLHNTQQTDLVNRDTAVTNAANTRMDAQDVAYYQHTLMRVMRTGDTMSGQLIAASGSGSGDPFDGLRGASLDAASGAIGSLRSTNGINVQLFKAGAGYTNGAHYVGFFGQRVDTVRGAITQVSTGVLYNETSDYRLKNDLGPVREPVERLMQLQPKHLNMKADGVEFDGFLAHEVQAVVPGAVVGEKDAVDDDGNMIVQLMDAGKLIPLLVATVQQLVNRVAELEAA